MNLQQTRAYLSSANLFQLGARISQTKANRRIQNSSSPASFCSFQISFYRKIVVFSGNRTRIIVGGYADHLTTTTAQAVGTFLSTKNPTIKGQKMKTMFCAVRTKREDYKRGSPFSEIYGGSRYLVASRLISLHIIESLIQPLQLWTGNSAFSLIWAEISAKLSN